MEIKSILDVRAPDNGETNLNVIRMRNIGAQLKYIEKLRAENAQRRGKQESPRIPNLDDIKPDILEDARIERIEAERRFENRMRYLDNPYEF